MSKSGFIKISRTLHFDPVWQNFTPEYRSIFWTILMNCAWKDTIQDDHGTLILVKAGQCLMTERQIALESFPPTTDQKTLAKNKSMVHRALGHFKKVGFSNQETNQTSNQKKTLHTIVKEELLEAFEPNFEPRNEPNSNQTRTIKEEDKTERTKSDDLIDAREPAKFDLEFDHRKLGKIKGLKSEIIEKFKLDGVEEKETRIAIAKMQKQNPLLNGSIENYLLPILQNLKPMKGKKCENLLPKKKKEESTKDKEFYTENDMSGAPLARFALQNGYKKK